jgi:hypothetical protein
MRRLALLSLSLLATAPAFAAPDWVVYQRGSLTTLAVDHNSVRTEKNNLLRFEHEERYSQQQRDPQLKISFYTRRMLVIGDCLQRRYAFASIDLFDQAGKSVYHSLFPLQDFQWKFQPAPDGSMGAGMLDVVCKLAPAQP